MGFQLPIITVEVYRKVRLIQEQIDEQDDDHTYTIQATSSHQDTAVVMVNDTAESAGLQGKSF